MTRENLSKWAAKNCFTLIFVAFLFVLTWIWILAVVIFFGGGIHGR
jgi:hypothetical protein